MKFRNHIKILLLSLAAVGMAGCVQNYGGGELPTPGNGNDVTITVTVPGQQIPTTRSIADGTGESTVAFIDLLIFGTDGKYSRTVHVDGSKITPVAGDQNYKVEFKAALTAEANDETVVVLANVLASTITTAVAGEKPSKQTVLSKLTHTSTAAWDADPTGGYTPIPMYGEVSIGNISTMTVTLTRMLARVDVVNSADDFTITEICVVNYNKTGNIAPAWNASTGAIYEETDEAYPYNKNLNPTRIDGAWKQTGGKLTYTTTLNKGENYRGEIYLYEAVKNPKPDPEDNMRENDDHTNAICLIVKGTYLGTDYYYRIDFTDGSGATTASETREYIPVYRNHLYTFDIEAVNGVGFPATEAGFESALKSFGVLNNLKTKLHIVDQTGVTNMVFNGQHYIGLGDAVTLGYESGNTAPVPCVTNYWEGWEIEKITYHPDSGDNWLTTTPAIGASPDPDNTEITLTTESENTGSSNRIATIHLKAGRLTHRLTVTQQFLPVFSVSPIILNFGYSAIAQSATIESNIAWSVASKPEWCSTVTPSSGTGDGSLNVNVDALGLNALSGSGYMRSGNIDFTNPDGISLASQSITVTQYAPRLAGSGTTLPMSENIPADGGAYTIHATANVSWGVKIYSTVSNTGAITSRTAIVTQTFGGSVVNNAAALPCNLQITVPEYESTGVRELEFVLYCTATGLTGSAEISIGKWNQDGIALWGGHADVLYFDDDNRLKIGRWGDQINLENYQKRMVFTKFGGVVGFTIEQTVNGTSWDNSYIKFNPTDYVIGTEIKNYAPSTYNAAASNDLPNVPGFISTDYDNNYGPNISSAAYHYYENIKKGKGDICQLLGLTADQIKGVANEDAFDELLRSRSAEYKGWRLPTARENASFVGGSSDNSTWIKWKNEDGNSYYYSSTTDETGSSTTWPYYYDNAGNRSKNSSAGVAGNPATGRFPVVTDKYNNAYTQVLPAAGHRNFGSGTVNSAGTVGYYWSSTPGSGTLNYHLRVFYSSVSPVAGSNYSYGYAVRCVRPE